MPAPSATTDYGFTHKTGDYRIDSLIDDTFWLSENFSSNATVISYSFPGFGSTWDAHRYPSNSQPWAPDFAPLTDWQQVAVRAVLDTWSNVANIQFVEVADTSENVGTIRFALTGYGMGVATAYAFLPSNWPTGGDVWFNPAHAFNSDWTAGTKDFWIMIHEMGHALGLKHPFSAGSNSVILPLPEDDKANSVMSYSALDGKFDTYMVQEPSTPMAYDILAIQSIYGANASYNSGDSSYRYAANGDYYETIWDAGGIDTIVVTGAGAALIDLRAGQWSQLGNALSIYGNIGEVIQPETVRIAYGVTIENATGGDGNDTITGNDSDNVLTGGAGSDSISGGVGFDFLDMRGGGNNFANGGNQSDTILGGSGNDELRGGKGRDSIMGGDGNDTIYSGLGFDTLTGGAGDDVFIVRGYDARFPFADLDPTITDFQDGIDHIGIEGVTNADIATILAAQQNLSGQVGVTISVADTKPAIITVLGVSQLDSSDVFAATDLIA